MEMGKQLYDAAFEGNESKLKTLIQQEPLILERSISLTPFHETPLHVAVLRGHLDFTRALLSHSPKLAAESDRLGRLPLHVAAAKGHVEITRELLRADGGACVARDKDGRMPLHVAVAKGQGSQVEAVVRELTRASPESSRERLERGESVYHLCVKSNNLEAFRVLVEESESRDLLGATDDDGNTVLHLAAIHRHLGIIKYLLARPEIDACTMNKKGLTAVNLIENSPRDLKGLEILNYLLQTNASNNSPSLDPLNKTSTSRPNSRSRSKSWKQFFTFSDKTHLEEFRGILFIVSAILVAIAILPIINITVSSGSILDDLYTINTLSLVPALAIMLLLVSGIPLGNKFCIWLIMQLMYTSIGFLGWNYLRAIISDDKGHVRVRLNDTVIAMCILFGMLIIVSLLNITRLVVLIATRITSCVKRRKFQARGETVSSNV